jgi:malonyl-CoA/methylmalonyl-CoA synthetase
MFDGLQVPAKSIAIEDGDGAHTWEHIRRRAENGGRRLAGKLEPGARVGMLLEPGAGWLCTLLAIWRAGCVAVPLTARHPPALREALLADAGAVDLITDADVLTSPNAPATPCSEARGGDVAMLLYTSGTTGHPKGAVLSHDNIAAGVSALVHAWGLEQRRALLHCLPLHHMHGIAIALLPCLTAGMRCVMLPRFDAEQVWERLADVDTFMAVPTMYHRLLDAFDQADEPTRRRWARAASELSLATSGSAAMPKSLAARWSAVAGSIPLERWGMTEVGVGLSNPLDPEQRRRGWVGRPIGDMQARIADDGELLVRGASVCERYWSRPDETAKAFVDGWFRTGDVVTGNAEDGIRIVGRRSVDIIKSGGYKISALEIEECMRDHPAIGDIAVVGIADGAYGERVAAAIVLRAPCEEEALSTYARQHLASYQVPRVFAFVDALPTNAVGKVQKPSVRELFEP